MTIPSLDSRPSTGAAPATAGSAFAYRALRRDGRLVRGCVRAPDRDGATALLTAQGLFPIAVDAQQPVDAFGAWSASRRMSQADLALGLRVLATLVDAGLSMRRIAATFGTLAPASWAPVVDRLQEALQSGQTLSGALADAPVRVPGVVIGILRAGEAGGGIAPALRAAAELAEESAATRTAIRSALAYPAVLALAGAASMFVLVGIVLPRFAAILGDLGQALPPTTRLVLEAGTVAGSVALPTAVGSAMAGALFVLWTNSSAGRAQWHATLLRVPIIGAIRRSAATARVAAALAALLERGVPLPIALTHAAAAAGDAAIAERIVHARTAVVAGRALGAALYEARAITAPAIRLVRAGEESGRLAALLGHAARLEREQSAGHVRRLVRLLEPTLILVFAGAVALVAAALLQAVYSVRPA